MAVMCDAYGEASVVTVVGDLTGADAAALRGVVGGALRQRSPTHVIIDLRHCDFMDDCGLEAILAARRLCGARGGRLDLANVGPDCRTILRAGRADAMLKPIAIGTCGSHSR